jgi:hypothetical protein
MYTDAHLLPCFYITQGLKIVLTKSRDEHMSSVHTIWDLEIQNVKM